MGPHFSLPSLAPSWLCIPQDFFFWGEMWASPTATGVSGSQEGSLGVGDERRGKAPERNIPGPGACADSYLAGAVARG